MKKLHIFCCAHFYDKNIQKLKNVIPSGTGNDTYPKNWFVDNTQNNIANLNNTYAELTFHYWIWKNYLDNFSKTDLIGFCQYRRFWLKKDHDKNLSYENLDDNLLNENNLDFSESEVFLTKSEKIFIKKKSILKYRGFIENIIDPKPLVNRFYHTAGLQFEISTKTKKIIYEVAKYIKKSDQDAYLNFLNTEKKINFHNMFITNKFILNEYMTDLFEWLNLCDEKIKKVNTNKESSRRIHAFLAERFLHFWFNRHYQISEIPYGFINTSKKNLNT